MTDAKLDMLIDLLVRMQGDVLTIKHRLAAIEKVLEQTPSRPIDDGGPAEKQFLSPAEAEAKWPGGRNQFYRALHDGVIRSLQHGKRFHIYREPYERLLRGEADNGGG